MTNELSRLYSLSIRCLRLLARSHSTRAIIRDTGCLQHWGATSAIRRQYSSGEENRSSTVDNEEIKRFNALAEKWWSRDRGAMGVLRTMNALRIPLIRDALLCQGNDVSLRSKILKKPKPLADLKVLDVGCGGGLLSEPLARLGASVTGLDASSEAIRTAEWHATIDPALAGRLEYLCAATEDIAEGRAETYDALVASEVIEHVADAPGFVASCCRLVKPGGSIFFTTINKTPMAYALGVVAAERLFNLLPAGTHDWNKFVAPEELQSLLSNNGFETRLIHGMLLNPLTQKWHWTTRTDISYALHAVKTMDPPDHNSNSTGVS